MTFEEWWKGYWEGPINWFSIPYKRVAEDAWRAAQNEKRKI